MNNYYDQHLHTHHSFDSTEKFENYLTKTDKQLVSTEHLDFYNPAEEFKDSIPEFNAYNSEITELQKKFDRPILRGIEIGYVPSQDAQIKEFLKDKPYDVLLLSTHQNGTIDFMDPVVKQMDAEKLIIEYYEQMIQSVENMPFANILTHFDYGVRQLDISVDYFKSIAEPLLIKLFKLVIQNDLAVELNAKSFAKYDNKHLYQYAIPLYISLGGTKFTLGSDAHVAEDYELAFEEMGALLKEHNIHQLMIYKEQKGKLVDF